MRDQLSAAQAAAFRRALSNIQAERHKAVQATLTKHLQDFQSQEPGTLSFVVKALLASDYSAEALAEWIGVSRPTIGRWADGDNIPRAAGYREWVVKTCVDFLEAAGPQRGSPMALKSGRPKLTTPKP